MQRATFFLVGTILTGVLTTNALATEPYSRALLDDRASVLTVGHPGSHHHGHGGAWDDRHGYSRSHHYRPAPYVFRPPAVIYPFPPPPPVLYPPVYPRHRHICGPGCGCGYPYNFYYRGNGWGLSFGF